MKITTPWNYDHKQQKKEKGGGTSQTIPDQTLPIRELVRRFANGLPIHTNQATPIYEGEDALPDVSKLDIAEREEVIAAAQEELAEIKQRIPKKKPQPKQLTAEQVDEIVERKLKAAKEGA